MAMAERTAQTIWEGNLARGSGSLSLRSSEVATDLPVTWASRTARSEGRTSPEELLAAAHSSCYSMALAAGLAEAGSPPERLDVTATVTFDQTEEGFAVGASRLVVRGRVPGIAEAAFEQAAHAAGEGCPISGAIRGNVDIIVDARLEG